MSRLCELVLDHSKVAHAVIIGMVSVTATVTYYVAHCNGYIDGRGSVARELSEEEE